VALTSLLSMIPYIALQMIGMQVVIENMGLGHGEVSLIIAFVILVLYTYHSGLKAPAMLSFGKAIMIFIVMGAAVVWIPFKLGGFSAIFSAATDYFNARGAKTGMTVSSAQMLPYASLALGSALACFMYPHALTGVLSSSGPKTIKLNAVLLPIFTVLLGLIALLGYMAIAAGIQVDNSSDIVPALFNKMFPQWFVGFSFAAIVIGALVPAAIMAIGTATIFTRNIWKTLFHPGMSPSAESKLAKNTSVVVLFASLCFAIFLPTQYAIDLQLIGGICILQIFPAVVGGLYLSKLNAPALLLGWLAGMTLGTWLTVQNGMKPICSISLLDHTAKVYIGMVAFALNLGVSGIGSLILKPGDELAEEKIIEPIS